MRWGDEPDLGLLVKLKNSVEWYTKYFQNDNVTQNGVLRHMHIKRK